MNAREARDLGAELARSVAAGRVETAYARLLPTLRARTPFRLLDLVGHAVGTGPSGPVNAFAECIATGRTEGGWVVIASILRAQLAADLSGALERSRYYVTRADVWYATDILGERVPGPALLAEFDRAVDALAGWRADPNRWVRRTVGVAVHFWAKRTQGEPERAAQARELLSLLEPLFEERTLDAVKGVGWGLKTLGRFYPEPSAEWLLHQTGRRPSALMLRKAVTYLPAERREQVLGAFGR